MLKLTIDEEEFFDDAKQKFYKLPAVTLELEHSLVSLSKWESDYQKPFLSTNKKSNEEIFAYLKAMVTTPGADLDVLDRCSTSTLEKIQLYIDSSQTATTFGTMPERRGPGEIITSELIYYWMILYNIPWEAQNWHLNRLFALIRICNIKSQPKKKMSKHEVAQRNRALNEQRKKQLGTRG